MLPTLPRWLLVAIALIGIGLEASGFSLLPPMLPGYVDELALSTTAAGLLSSSFAAGSIVGGLAGIRVVAAVGLRRSTAAAFALMAAPLPVLAGSFPFAVVAAARVVEGTGSGLLWAALLAWLNGLHGASRRGHVLGLATAAAVTGNLVGPPLGALAVDHGRASVCLPLAAATLLVGALTVLAQRSGAAADAEELGSATAVSTRRRFGVTVTASLVPGAMLGGLLVVLPLRLADLRAGSGVISVSLTAAAAVSAVASPLFGRVVDRTDPHRTTAAALAVAAAGLTAFAVTDSAVTVAVGGAAVFVLCTTSFIAAGSLVQHEAERCGLSNRVVGATVNLTFATGELVGGPAVGALLGAAGHAAAVGAVAVSAVAAGVTVTALRAWPVRSVRPTP